MGFFNSKVARNKNKEKYEKLQGKRRKGYHDPKRN